jgi:hypothetical protein
MKKTEINSWVRCVGTVFGSLGIAAWAHSGWLWLGIFGLLFWLDAFVCRNVDALARRNNSVTINGNVVGAPGVPTVKL